MAKFTFSERATCLPVLSLKKISLINFTTIFLCNNKELTSLITKCDFNTQLCEVLNIKNRKAARKVEARADKLLSTEFNIPEKFKNMILECIWPMTYRINRWKSTYAPTINDNFLQYCHWTDQGRVDNKRSAKCIIENKTIRITKRFILACRLCLKKEIYEMWEIMSKDDKRNLEEEESEEIDKLLCFWMNKLRGEDNVSRRTFISPLIYTVRFKLREATEYLFSEIPESEKDNIALLGSNLMFSEENVVKLFDEEEIDIFYFLLLQMTETSQNNFFNSHLYEGLIILLHNPGKKEFLEVYQENLSTTSKNDQMRLLLYIIFQICLDVFKDNDYYHLFVSVWQMLNDSLKICLIEGSTIVRCFGSLISIYFRYLLDKKPSKKAKRPSPPKTITSVDQDKWDLLLFFIKNEMVTTESLKNHRLSVLKCLKTRKSNKPAWLKLLKFVRDEGPTKKRK